MSKFPVRFTITRSSNPSPSKSPALSVEGTFDPTEAHFSALKLSPSGLNIQMSPVRLNTATSVRSSPSKSPVSKDRQYDPPLRPVAQTDARNAEPVDTATHHWPSRVNPARSVLPSRLKSPATSSRQP